MRYLSETLVKICVKKMISYLQGNIKAIQKINNNRVILTLEVNHIGYDLQIPPRMVQQLPAMGQEIQIFTHLQIREDQMILYGFAAAAERDLYRQLISVSGIGAQLAIGLLDTLGLQDLVQAIVTGNTKMLTKAPGVGTKTAERISLELKSKLAEWRQQAGVSLPVTIGLNREMQEDIEMTLLALGYTDREVMETLQVLSNQDVLAKNSDVDEWIKAALAYLSQEL